MDVRYLYLNFVPVDADSLSTSSDGNDSLLDSVTEGIAEAADLEAGKL